MKCDELEIKYVGYGMGFYPTEDVDAAIAELKDKCQMHDFFWEGCGFSKMGFKNTIDVANYVDNLKAENEKLKESNANLERAYDRIETASAKTLIELRATIRALWLMTAEWAEAMGLASCNIANKFMSRENFEVSDEYRNKTVKKYRHRQVVFYKYADYCRQKAEEYK